MPNWHIKPMAFRAEQVQRGELTRLIVNVPSRHFKSHVFSVALPAFIHGHDPTRRILIVTNNLDLAAHITNEYRAIVSSAWYKRCFPRMRVSDFKNTQFEVVTTERGYFKATSIDSMIIGRGADVMIIDDPQSPDDSTAELERINEAFYKKLRGRLNNKKRGAIVLVMQRLDVDDMTGYLLSRSKGWTLLKLSAIATQDEEIQIGENAIYTRRAGDALHPELEGIEELEIAKLEVGPHIFAAQYQQDPIPRAGALWTRECFCYYDDLPPRAASTVLLSFDLAFKSKEENSFSVGIVCYIHNGKYYVADILRGHLDYHTFEERALALAREYRPGITLIEEAGTGLVLAAQFDNNGFPAVTVKPEGDKVARASKQLAMFRTRRVLFRRGAPWVADLETEFLGFPRGRYDDQVDALVQALGYEIKTRAPWNDRALAGFAKFNEALAFNSFWNGR
jgi:predicted phage terminase large subunit-like protein